MKEFKPLFSVRRSEVTADMFQEPKLLNLESQLLIDHAMSAELEKRLADDTEFPYCSCERLHQRKQVTASMRPSFPPICGKLAYCNKSRCSYTNTLYVCQYCRPNLIQKPNTQGETTNYQHQLHPMSL